MAQRATTAAQIRKRGLTGSTVGELGTAGEIRIAGSARAAATASRIVNLWDIFAVRFAFAFVVV